MTFEFKIGQRVRVYPESEVLRMHHDYMGYEGVVDCIELEDDNRITYRVRLDYEMGQGYPYYASELKECVHGNS